MEPFIGEIRMFAGNFAPRGWAFCDGGVLRIAENAALFAVVGTLYGGDGVQTFAVPDLRGRIPVGTGAGPGLTPRANGDVRGTEAVALGVQHLPSHTHAMPVGDRATDTDPRGAVPAVAAEVTYAGGGAAGSLDAATVAPAGEGQPHENLQPYRVVSFIIALEGIFPARG